MIKTIFKILRIISGSLIVFLLFLIILIRAGYLNGFVSKIISAQANKNLNAKLIIGSIRGSLLSDFKVNDISLIYKSDTILMSKYLEIRYSLKGFFRKNIEIEKLILGETSVRLWREQDSIWNIMKIVPPSDEIDTTDSPFDWMISLNEFRLTRLSLSIAPLKPDSLLPQNVQTRILAKAFYSSDSMNVDLDSLNLVTQNPDFEIVNLKGIVSRSESGIRWIGLVLKLKESMAQSSGVFKPDSLNNVAAFFEFMPLAFADFRSLFPSIEIYGTPDILLNLNGDERRYEAEVEIVEGEQKVHLSGRVNDIDSDPVYTATLVLTKIDAAYWTHDSTLNSNISGNLSLSGKGFDLRENVIDLKASFSDLVYGDYFSKGLVAEASKNKDNVSGTISARTFIGNLDLDFKLNRIFENPAYDILCSYRNVNMDNLPGIDSLTSDLNGDIRIKGSGLSLKDLVASITFESFDSEISGINLSAFNINADYNRGNYYFEIPGMGEPYFNLSALGEGNIQKSNNISFSFEPMEPELLLSSFGIPPVEAVGKITGTLSGNVDSLNIITDILLDSITLDTLSLHKIDSEINAIVSGKRYQGNVNLNTGELNIGAVTINSVGMQGRFNGDSISADIQIFVSDSLSADFSGDVTTLENPAIRIRQLGINYAGMQWNTPGDSAWISLEENALEVNDFQISSGDQNLSLDGRFAFEGQENIVLDITDLNLSALPLNLFVPYDISGRLNSYFSVEGSSSEPVIHGKIALDEVVINNFNVDSIRSVFNYDKEKLDFSGSINTGMYEPFLISLLLPIHISLSDSVSILNDDTGLSASISLDSLRIQDLSGLIPVENTTAGGYASFRAEVRNSISRPDISGILSISNGSFSNTEYGMNYRNVSLAAKIDSSRLSVDEFRAETGKGKGSLVINGFIELGSIDSLAPGNFEMKLNAKDFQALESNSLELNFNSDIVVTGSTESSKLKGGINVNSSKVNVDYFGDAKQSDDPNPPLLIEALRDTVSITQPVDTTRSDFSFSSNDLYKKMAGEIELIIPGNTWIIGKDMNFELEGSLRAVKSAEIINLFGDLNVKRGYYKVYGRNFEFNTGKITFTGGSEINPELDFEIVYSFRDIEKELRELKLSIKGRMLQPEIQFSLDDEMIEEKDAISYIIFGKSVNQLGDGEKSKISGENVAMGAALGQLSSALKGVLQEEAGVDVFEVTGGEDWKSGSVTIGKYLTNKLFLSYDRSFNFDKQTKTTSAEKIMLEYQILRNLVFKATNQNVNSGFDLIFKKTWK